METLYLTVSEMRAGDVIVMINRYRVTASVKGLLGILVIGTDGTVPAYADVIRPHPDTVFKVLR